MQVNKQLFASLGYIYFLLFFGGGGIYLFFYFLIFVFRAFFGGEGVSSICETIPYLFWCSLSKVITEYFLRKAEKYIPVVDALVRLAFYPEIQVFFAEFRAQENMEELQPNCRENINHVKYT